MNEAPAGLDACTRCGLCLQACPTYRDLRVEADSPRGRIFMMKQVADGAEDVDASLAEHLYVCLGCRACETACPSGVPFGRLLETGRYQVERRGEIDPSRRAWRWFRRIAFEWVLPHRALFSALVAPATLLQRWRWLARLADALPLPTRARRVLASIPKGTARQRLPIVTPSCGELRARVGLLRGCVMDALFQEVHVAVARVLSYHGCEVVVAPGQWCCGALNVHAGERDHAKRMARRNIDAFEAAGVDFIVVDSAGCGAAMKEYADLLGDDPDYARRAAAFAAKVKDFSDLLCELGPRTGLPVWERVTYQDACHLAHGQKIREQPRALLKSIPGIEFVEMRWADRCCGAAGIYSMTHPDLSGRILAEKMESIAAAGAGTVVVTNPGCHMQLLAGAAQHMPQLRVRHLAEILNESYRA